MWFFLAVISAVCLGFYDVFKKISLRDNAVIPVLLLNTLIGSLLFLPLILSSYAGVLPASSHWFVPNSTISAHLWVFLKAIIVLSSWICGYFAMKHLPITLVGPINATRPVMTLLGAMVVFNEHFNLWQWGGVVMAIYSFFLLNKSGRKEGIDFLHNRWILLLVLAALLGACSGLYDKFLLSRTQSYFCSVLVQSLSVWVDVSYIWILVVANSQDYNTFSVALVNCRYQPFLSPC